mgnify:CR=1 FL=1
MTSVVAPPFQDHTRDVVSGHNATDKTPMYEMPLHLVFGVWVLGLGRAFICIGLLPLAFCPRSQDVSEGNRYNMGMILFKIHLSISYCLPGRQVTDFT